MESHVWMSDTNSCRTPEHLCNSILDTVDMRTDTDI